MLSKRLSNMLLTGAAVAGLGAAANAALVIDLRATTGSPGVVITNQGKTVTGTVNGSTVNFDVFALVTDSNNAVTTDQGILSFAGSFLSDGGGVRGNLAAAAASTMRGSGFSNGLMQDLDADTDLDVGSNTNTSSANFFNARSSAAPQPVFGSEVLVGNLTFTVTTSSSSPTSVNFRPRAAGTAGSWFEDGSQITSSAFSAGTPVLVSGASGVPEPASLAMASIAGLGMLARRRVRD